MGINKLYDIMNEMKEDAGIVNPRITPYSSRKRLVQKLHDEGVPANQIVQISGHKNINSINNYSKINMQQQHTISDILSNKQNETNLQVQPATLNQPELSSGGMFQRGFFAGSNFHGSVTFNFNKSSETQTLCQMSTVNFNPNTGSGIEMANSPGKRQFKRIRMISDSESD